MLYPVAFPTALDPTVAELVVMPDEFKPLGVRHGAAVVVKLVDAVNALKLPEPQLVCI